MQFQLKKISDHGTSNPMVARLSFQTQELVKFVYMTKDKKDEIFALFHGEIQPRLLECDDISKEILKEISDVYSQLKEKGFTTQSNGRVIEVPHIIRLDQRIEQFLYSAKSALRDLAKIFNIFFDKKFTEARYDKVLEWVSDEFGEECNLTQTIRDNHDSWIKKVVSMRNAVEHPGGYSGHLHIRNFELVSKSHPNYPAIEEPTWYLNEEERVSIVKDLQTIVSNILGLSEEILVVCMYIKGIPDIFQVVEIPESNRKPECPIRLQMAINPQNIDTK